MLQYVAVRCSVLQYVAECCSVLQYVAYVAVCCSVLSRVRQIADRYLLQCVAVCCSMSQCVAACCSMLQHVAACCSVLQCVAVCVRLLIDICHALLTMGLSCAEYRLFYRVLLQKRPITYIWRTPLHAGLCGGYD